MFFLFLFAFLPCVSSTMIVNATLWVFLCFILFLCSKRSFLRLFPHPFSYHSEDIDRQLQEVCGAGRPTERLNEFSQIQRGVLAGGGFRCNQNGNVPISFE